MRISKEVVLPEDARKTILWYLENYWGVIATIAKERNDAIFGSGVFQELGVPIQSGQTSDSTLRKTLDLLSKEDVNTMIEWIKIINQTYRYFQERDPEKAELIRYRFFLVNPKLKTREEIINELFVSRDVYYRLINGICGVAGIKATEKGLISSEGVKNAG